jgi:outer membrane receptor protein involved in Fe transport
MNINKRKNLLATFIAVFAAGATTQGAMAQDGEAATAQSGIDEIVVTATRRATSLNDTAISIAAIGGEEISSRGLTEMNDYLRTVPGVTMLSSGVGQNVIVIRGLGVRPQSESSTAGPSVGVYFGEVSLGAASSGGSNPDLRMVDLEHVEILRGPQGTLFGSSALAGVVRNIPHAPKLSELEGSVKAGYSSTGGFGGDNAKYEGTLNIPLIEDVLAVRAVAYHHDTSGYIKNIAGTQLATDGVILNGISTAATAAAFGSGNLYQDENDIGAATYTGGRISALWAPTDQLNITLQYITQKAEQDSLEYVQQNTGGYTQAALQVGINTPFDSTGGEDDISITNLVVEYDFGWANFLSSTVQFDNDSSYVYEGSPDFGGTPSIQPILTAYEAFTQEFRLVSQSEGELQYVVGAYYEDSESKEDVDIYITADAFAANPLVADQFNNGTTKQLSFYAELSYEFSEQWMLTGGVRRFDYERELHYFLDSPLFGSADSAETVDEKGESFKLNLSYSPSDDALIYLQWSEGFRLGNAATLPPPAAA